MAITKAKLIADGVITVDNLHASHGITTTHIGEGEKLFYTDARVSSYLTSNNYTTSAGGYFYDATLSANILTFSKSDGTTDSVDLSLYLDDTNLARLVSGTLDGQTGIATFTRDDSSTFTIDFSAFLADANDYVSSGSFDTTTGVLTLTRLGGGTVTVDLDGKYAEASHTHLWADITDRPTALSTFTNDLGNYGGFLTSFTETDPVYVASSWYTTTNNASNWNTAYGWGNHATAGYLTAEADTLSTVTARGASTSASISLSSGVPFVFNSTGTDTYNQAVLYYNYTDGFFLENSWSDDSTAGTRTPISLGWRGGIGYGGLRLEGKTKILAETDYFTVNHQDTYALGIKAWRDSTYVEKFVIGRTGADMNSRLVIGYDIAGAENAYINRDYTTARLNFNRGATTDMVLTGEGRLLVGASADLTSQRLQVNGFIDVTSGTGALRFYDGTTYSGGLGTADWAFGGSNPSTHLGLIAPNKLIMGAGAATMWMTTDYRVGIGTDNPGYKLEVAGTGRFTGALTFSSADRGFEADVAGGISFYGNEINSGSQGVNGNLYLGYRRTNNVQITPALSISSTTYFGGNVSIGVTSYPAKLTLPLEEENNYKILFKSAGTTNAGISTVDQSGAGIYIGANSYVNSGGNITYDDSAYPSSGIYFDGWNEDCIKFYEGTSGAPTERMRIANGGAVGIGTTSPSYKLDVAGTGYFSGDLTVNSNINLTANNSYLNFNRAGINNDGLLIYKTAGANKWLLGAWGNSNENFYLYSYGVGNAVVGVDYSTGNVGIGIGTTSASCKLDVAGTTRVSMSNAGSEWISTWDNTATNGHQMYFGYGNAAGTRYGLYVTGGTGNSGFDLAVANKFYVNGDGNVGVGTGGTNAKLTVQSSGDGTIFSVRGSLSGYSYPNIFEVLQTGADAHVNIKDGAGNVVTSLSGYTGTDTYFLSDVGIGVTSPVIALSVRKDVNDWVGQFKNYGDSAYGLTVDLSGSTGGQLTYALGVYTQGGTGMFVRNDGYTGIGTATPADKLEIYSGTYHKIRTFFEGSYTSGFKFSDYYGGVKYNAGIDTLTLFANHPNVGSITFETRGVERMRIDSTGQLGIGTTNPQTNLQIGDYTNTNLGLTFAAQNNGISYINFFDSNNTEGLYIKSVGESYGGTLSFGARWDDYEDKIVMKMYQTSAAGPYNARLGIGATSPDAPIEVVGGDAMTGGWNRNATLSATYPVLTFNSNGSKWAGIGYDYSTAMRVWVNATNNNVTGTGTIAATIKNNGYVGINQTDPQANLHVGGSIMIDNPSSTGGTNTNQAIYIKHPTQANEYFTMGFKDTSRSGEQMQHPGGPYYNSQAFYIECGATEAGGICLDQDSVHVYGSSDGGATFRVIDKDADLVTFEMLQSSWNGVFRGDVIAYGSMSSLSDKRIKVNIEPYENTLDRLCSLGVYSYNKITAPKDKKDRKEIGVIAQEVQNVFPELVGSEKVSKPESAGGLEEVLTVDYEHLTAILLQSIKELRGELKDQQKQIEELKAIVNGITK